MERERRRTKTEVEARNFFEEWLTDGKSMNVGELLSHYNISPRQEGSTAYMEEWGDR